MCRNIKTLFNFEPPATELEIRDASLQFVRKLSGFTVPSKANEAAFEAAVEKVADAARELDRRDGHAGAGAQPRHRSRQGTRTFDRALRRALSGPRASARNGEGIRMLFMVIERFRDNDMVPIYERVRDKGRSLPDGLKLRRQLGRTQLLALLPVDGVRRSRGCCRSGCCACAARA